MLDGLVGYSASEPLGLPNYYGMFCVLAGAVIVLLAALFVRQRPEMELLPANEAGLEPIES